MFHFILWFANLFWLNLKLESFAREALRKNMEIFYDLLGFIIEFKNYTKLFDKFTCSNECTIKKAEEFFYVQNFNETFFLLSF